MGTRIRHRVQDESFFNAILIILLGFCLLTLIVVIGIF